MNSSGDEVFGTVQHSALLYPHNADTSEHSAQPRASNDQDLYRQSLTGQTTEYFSGPAFSNSSFPGNEAVAKSGNPPPPDANYISSRPGFETQHEYRLQEGHELATTSAAYSQTTSSSDYGAPMHVPPYAPHASTTSWASPAYPIDEHGPAPTHYEHEGSGSHNQYTTPYYYASTASDRTHLDNSGFGDRNLAPMPAASSTTHAHSPYIVSTDSAMQEPQYEDASRATAQAATITPISDQSPAPFPFAPFSPSRNQSMTFQKNPPYPNQRPVLLQPAYLSRPHIPPTQAHSTSSSRYGQDVTAYPNYHELDDRGAAFRNRPPVHPHISQASTSSSNYGSSGQSSGSSAAHSLSNTEVTGREQTGFPRSVGGNTSFQASSSNQPLHYSYLQQTVQDTMHHQRYDLNPNHHYAGEVPSYMLHQYGRPAPLSANAAVFPHHLQPSPAPPGSSIPSPSLATYTPALQIPPRRHSDYFGQTYPIYDHARPAHDQFGARQIASGPTSLSPASLRSDEVMGKPQSESGGLSTVGTSADASPQLSGLSRTSRGGGRHKKSPKASTTPYTKKETRILDGTCSDCGTLFATINLRGHPQDFKNDFDLVYYCLKCAPVCLGTTRSALFASLGLPMPADSMQESSTNTLETEAQNATATTQLDNISPPPVSVKIAHRGPRKRSRITDVSSAAICDVCARWIGNGAPVPREVGAELVFNVEIVCTLCREKYRRCSDCGGGGGARLGVGKWRCKELFSPGRKTCDLSHARQSSITSMEYCTSRIADIPDEEMAELVAKCQAVFESSFYSSLAVPEILERGTALAETYEDVVGMVQSGWTQARELIETDIEDSASLRRYLGLRWSAPRPRKIASRKAAKQEEKPVAVETQETDPEPKVVLRPEMTLSGYVTGEWDIHGGTFYITVSVPYSTGEQYEGSAHLIGLLQKRVATERRQMVEELSAQGRHTEAAAIPPLQHAFTLLFFSPDSKLIAYMESKRQLIPLKRYLEKYPDTNPKIFPPYRQAYLAAHKAEDLTILVRRIHPPSPGSHYAPPAYFPPGSSAGNAAFEAAGGTVS